MPIAIENSETKLEAFEGFLTEQYKKYGFKDVDWVLWNEEYRAEGWTDQMDTSDLVYMELDYAEIKRCRTPAEHGQAAEKTN